jgi:hypothetical protein
VSEPSGFSLEETVDWGIILAVGGLGLSPQIAWETEGREALIQKYGIFQELEQPDKFPFFPEVAWERAIHLYSTLDKESCIRNSRYRHDDWASCVEAGVLVDIARRSLGIEHQHHEMVDAEISLVLRWIGCASVGFPMVEDILGYGPDVFHFMVWVAAIVFPGFHAKNLIWLSN